MEVTFGDRLRRHRLAASLTQEALAERSGLSVEAIGALERGRRRAPRHETLMLLADALCLVPAERDALAALAALARRRAPVGLGSRPLTRPPVLLTPLVGRGSELETAATMLRGGVRLLTLTGAPGVGKTRLALAVAGELLADHPDGVIFVSLAPLTDPGLVADTMREALDLKETTAWSTLDSLAELLRSRRVLLLMDNFEHVLPAARLLAELLQACPGLRFMVTSRAALHLRGEHELPVPPLPPAAAAELFVQRARAITPTFALGAEDRASVVELCRRLDGLPLALEFAASWTRLLTPRALLARLERQSLPLLVGGARDLPERQGTMRRTLDWSHDLLGPTERELFRRLSVFAGGALPEAVEAVCGAGSPQRDVLLPLVNLVDANLVVSDVAGQESRVGMLETVREYARERLEASGEAGELARAHALHYAGLAEAADRELTGGDQAAWLAVLAREHDNLRAALRWARDSGNPELGLRMAGSLWRFWEILGHSREGLGWLEALIAAAPEAEPAARARALNGAGNLARRLADHPRARAHYDACLAIYRSTGDERGESSVLNNLGNLAYLGGDLEQAIALHQQNVGLRRRLGDQRAVSVALNNLAIAVHQSGDHERALELHQEALSIRRARGDKHGTAYTLVNLGELAVVRGDHAQARAWLEECTALCTELGDRQLLAGALGNLGHVARAGGDAAAAHANYRESLRVLVTLGEWRVAPYSLEGMAATYWMLGDTERAARLYGAAARIRGSTGMPRLPNERADHDRVERAVRDSLGEARFAVARASGSSDSLKRIIAELLADAAEGR